MHVKGLLQELATKNAVQGARGGGGGLEYAGVQYDGQSKLVHFGVMSSI
jgi:hypothetical protein